MVQAAGHDGSVDEDSNLIAQRIAEHFLLVIHLMLQVGPLKHIVVLKEQIVREFPSVVSLRPGTRLMLGNKIQNGLVLAVMSALVPKAQHDDAATAGCLHSERHHLADVLSEVCLAVALMRMERNLHLVRQLLQHIGATGEQRAVGGKHWREALLTRHPHELRQLGMEERLAHKMKIEEAYLTLKSRGQHIKLLQSQRMLRPIGLRTKYTIEVAYIGYFKIASGYHAVKIQRLFNKSLETHKNFIKFVASEPEQINIIIVGT